MSKQPKRIGVFSDTHCGHLVGLTPPQWQIGTRPTTTKLNKFAKLQKELWGFFAKKVDSLRPFDVAIWDGDLIDGRGKAAEGGVEHITTDREEQAAMSRAAIEFVGAKKNVLIYGTAFHVSADGEDWESIIAREVGAEKIGSHEWVRVGGVTFDVKHHVGSSGVPHGRFTALAREQLWAELWSSRKGFPLASVLLRGHVHYFGFCGDNDYLAMTLPSLQGLGSKHGSRRCSGTVDFGFVHFDIEGGKVTGWDKHITAIQAQVPKVLVL